MQSVRQLAARLEDATSSERIKSLEELQTLSKMYPTQVCEIALRSLLDVLQERGSAEEYLETLNVLEILIKSNDSSISLKNVNAILSEGGSVELLLDLLDHSDATVGVMASQTLTQLHNSNSSKVESMIQNIPDGMNKLLQRLPDASREAVRDQALVLVQKLTAHSEEMKKTLVFNEGFEVLFGIIQKEYDSEVQFADKGPVVQDCLKIMANTLRDSETCQRFFFGMGTDWSIRLAFFFDPALFENPMDNPEDRTGAVEEEKPWFHRPGCVSCATLALQALSHASSPANAAHQNLLGVTLQGLIPAALYALARNGPVEMVESALELLLCLVDDNEEVARSFSEATVKVTEDIAGVNVPEHYTPLPERTYGYADAQVVEDEDGMEKLVALSCTNVVCLMAERYTHTPVLWSHDDHQERERPYLSSELSGACLRVLDAYFAAGGASGCTLIVQTVIAPPPPPPDADTSFDEMLQAQKTALGPILCGEMVQSSCMLLTSIARQGGATSNKLPARTVFIRACNLLGLLFVNGGEVSRELLSTITMRHVYEGRSLLASWPQDGSAGEAPAVNVTFLAFLLSTAARLARAGAAVPAISDSLVAILRLLAAVVSGCPRSVLSLLQDPSNLFVMDLASATSANAGVPVGVRAAACLFLGACCNALPVQSGESNHNGAHNETPASTRRELLLLIDRGMTLKRLSETLRESLDLSATASEPDSAFHYCDSFRRFFDSEVETVMKAIYVFYSEGSAATPIDSSGEGLFGEGGAGSIPAPGGAVDAERALREVVELQTVRIAELEERLSKGTLTSQSGDAANGGAGAGADVVMPLEGRASSHQESILIREHESTIAELQRLLREREASHAQLYQEYQEQLQKEGPMPQGGAAEEAAGDLRSYILDLEARNASLSEENERLMAAAASIGEEQAPMGSVGELQAALAQREAQVQALKTETAGLNRNLEHMTGVMSAWEQALEQRDEMLISLQADLEKARADAASSLIDEEQPSSHANNPFANPSPQSERLQQAEDPFALGPGGDATHNAFSSEDKSSAYEHDSARERADQEAALMLKSLQGELADKDRRVAELERDLSTQLTVVAEAKRALVENNEVKTMREALIGLKSQLKDVTRQRNELQAGAGTSSALAEKSEVLERTQADLKVKDAELQVQLQAIKWEAEQAEKWRAEAQRWESEMAATRGRHEEEVSSLREALQQAVADNSRIYSSHETTPRKMSAAKEPGSPSSPVLGSPIPLTAQALQLQTPLTGMSGITQMQMSGMGNKSRYQDASALLGGSSAQQREISRLTAEVAGERRRLQGLQDTHNDLLSLLAQEELELGVFREMLESVGGDEKVHEAILLAQRGAVEKYGSYVNLHDSSAVVAESSAGLDFGEQSTDER